VSQRATIILHGHSEGAQIFVRMLEAESRRAPNAAWLPRVERLILTGLPLEPILSGATRQVAVFMPRERAAFARAQRDKDDDWLLRLGLGSAYFEHPSAREHLEPRFMQIAERLPLLEVDLFHGELDVNAPLFLVRRLVASHDRARASGKPSLLMRLHTYPGAGHALDERFADDIKALVRALPNRAEESATAE
jgi:pimeloyl-ACP methyl ester carboxylesterase